MRARAFSVRERVCKEIEMIARLWRESGRARARAGVQRERGSHVFGGGGEEAADGGLDEVDPLQHPPPRDLDGPDLILYNIYMYYINIIHINKGLTK